MHSSVSPIVSTLSSCLVHRFCYVLTSDFFKITFLNADLVCSSRCPINSFTDIAFIMMAFGKNAEDLLATILQVVNGEKTGSKAVHTYSSFDTVISFAMEAIQSHHSTYKYAVLSVNSFSFCDFCNRFESFLTNRNTGFFATYF